jgi:hypothetical protein
MLSWKTGNLSLFLLAIANLLFPLLFSKGTVINQGLIMAGLMFLTINIVRAKGSPTVLGSLFTALIGLSYIFGLMTTMNVGILWTVSILLFVGVLIFEFGIFKFGPSNSKAKVLTIIPLAILGFSMLLSVAGYNPLMPFSWSSQWLMILPFLSIMLFCWIYVLDIGGWKPLKGRTNLALNLLALVAFALIFLASAQGTLFVL